MKRTKLLALALAGVMVLALLTGCGKTGMNARERAVAEGIAAEISDFLDQKACYYIIQGGPNLSNRVGKICTTTIKSEGKTYRFMLYLLEDKTVTIT